MTDANALCQCGHTRQVHHYGGKCKQLDWTSAPRLCGCTEYVRTEYVPTTPPPRHPIKRWLAQWRRDQGPTIRYWDADMTLIGTVPPKPETWSHWATRQARRALR